MEDLLFEGEGTCCCLVEGPNGKLLSRLDFKQKPPSQSVDYSRDGGHFGGFASRLPRKLSEAALSGAGAAETVFICFNCSGSPGSDAGTAFCDKRVSKEVQDTAAVVGFVRNELLTPEGSVHLIGVSTGAIIASLMRGVPAGVSSISVIAGLLDTTHTAPTLDFNEAQLRDINEGAESVGVKFWLPVGCSANVEGAVLVEGAAPEAHQVGEWAPHTIQLGRGYVEEFISGCLDVKGAVVGEAKSPLLVIHGAQDQHVPVGNGEELYEHASEPKKLVVIPKANHLLTSSSHLKKAANAIMEWVQTHS